MKKTLDVNEYKKDRVKRITSFQDQIKNDTNNREERKNVTIKILTNLYIETKIKAIKEMTSVSNIIEIALKEYLYNK